MQRPTRNYKLIRVRWLVQNQQTSGSENCTIDITELYSDCWGIVDSDSRYTETWPSSELQVLYTLSRHDMPDVTKPGEYIQVSISQNFAKSCMVKYAYSYSGIKSLFSVVESGVYTLLHETSLCFLRCFLPRLCQRWGYLTRQWPRRANLMCTLDPLSPTMPRF